MVEKIVFASKFFEKATIVAHLAVHCITIHATYLCACVAQLCRVALTLQCIQSVKEVRSCVGQGQSHQRDKWPCQLLLYHA